MNHRKMFLYFDWYFSENQFIESSFFFFQKGLILWDIFLKERSSLQVILKKKKRFNSLSQVEKGGFNALSHSILWVKLKKSILDSVSRIQKKIGSILWFILQKFNPLSHIEKNRVQFLESIYKRVQFIETFKKDGSILRVTLKKKRQFFESYWKKVQFFEFWEWVIL